MFNSEIIVRLFLSLVIGLIIGIERQVLSRHRRSIKANCQQVEVKENL